MPQLWFHSRLSLVVILIVCCHIATLTAAVAAAASAAFLASIRVFHYNSIDFLASSCDLWF